MALTPLSWELTGGGVSGCSLSQRALVGAQG